ncbi:MAG: phosphate/phosphite/phosphonate ABC transporter substrate-binding protein [Lentisphaeraceae bacterium]|nr:phosphate/phosphite/phosphonate ABC transporter substrate-binding protein [Lentisphaeraceae bacterium]
MRQQKDYVRIAVETDDSFSLFDNVKLPQSKKILYNISEISNGIDGADGLKNNVFDAVCVDALAAQRLLKQSKAIPLAFIMNENQKPVEDRLVLLGHSKVPEFLSQTKGLSLMKSGVSGKMQRAIFDQFISAKYKKPNEWFSEVSVNLSTKHGVGLLLSGRKDLLLIRESEYKAHFPEEERSKVKVLWYSESIPVRIVMINPGLSTENVDLIKQVFTGNVLAEHQWKLFSESLFHFDEWVFKISGKPFGY